MRRARWVVIMMGGCAFTVGTMPMPAQRAPDVPTGRPVFIGPPVPDSIPQDPQHLPPAVTLTPDNTVLQISVRRRRLWVLVGRDTLLTAPVSLASGRSFTFAGAHWRFATPRGRRVIQAKRTDPVWMPPDWHYAEVAARQRLKLVRLPITGYPLRNGARLAIRDSVVGLIPAGDTSFLPLPVDEHVVFDATLFIPPVETRNRRLKGELGAYALDLGDGYMMHGTRDQTTIGSDGTHGCIRLKDPDLLWLYTYVPVGVLVVIRD